MQLIRKQNFIESFLFRDKVVSDLLVVVHELAGADFHAGVVADQVGEELVAEAGAEAEVGVEKIAAFLE